MFAIQSKSGTWYSTNPTSGQQQLPEPKLGGIAVTDEPVWSEETGRVSDGTMKGDIRAWKTTVEVAWPPLTYAQAKTIRDAIGAGDKTRNFFKIRFSDIEEGSTLGTMTTEKTVYVGNVPRLLYSTSSVYQRYYDIKLTFIEQ